MRSATRSINNDGNQPRKTTLKQRGGSPTAVGIAEQGLRLGYPVKPTERKDRGVSLSSGGHEGMPYPRRQAGCIIAWGRRSTRRCLSALQYRHFHQRSPGSIVRSQNNRCTSHHPSERNVGCKSRGMTPKKSPSSSARFWGCVSRRTHANSKNKIPIERNASDLNVSTS